MDVRLAWAIFFFFFFLLKAGKCGNDCVMICLCGLDQYNVSNIHNLRMSVFLTCQFLNIFCLI